MKRFLGILVATLVTTGLFAQDDRYTMMADTVIVDVGFDAVIPITLDSVTGTLGAPDNLTSWSYGICHDDTLASIVDVVHGTDALAANPLGPPGFSSINTTFGGGFALAIIIDLFGNFFLSPGTDLEISVATYNRTAPGQVPLAFCGTIGNPAVEVLVVNQAGVSAIPQTVDGLLDEMVVVPPTEFIRGDANQDSVLNITDVIFLALWLFGAGPAGDCESAADVNDNGALDPLEDVLGLVQYLFQAGPAPAAPFPTCGPDGNMDTLTCDMTSCP
ncbi:MAG: hypothetical protein AAF581_12250 [Planctomycetota bacterium]